MKLLCEQQQPIGYFLVGTQAFVFVVDVDVALCNYLARKAVSLMVSQNCC